jgi:Leucine-rich repeat (LRR) protein
LGQLRQLQKLSLAHNGPTTVPSWIGRLTALRELDLSGNPVVSLPTEVAQLQHLHSLDLSATKIPVLPPELARLLSLRLVRLQDSMVAAKTIVDMQNRWPKVKIIYTAKRYTTLEDALKAPEAVLSLDLSQQGTDVCSSRSVTTETTCNLTTQR